MLVPDPATLTLREVWDAVMGNGQVLGVHDTALDCVKGQAMHATLKQIEREAAAVLERRRSPTCSPAPLRAALSTPGISCTAS